MMVGLILPAIVQMYSSTMRETGETAIPMKASTLAVLVNMCFNYILIFGKFGAPKLGVAGAAIATVISRFAELAFILIYAKVRRDKFPYLTGVYRTMRVPLELAKEVTIKGMPLMVNELQRGPLALPSLSSATPPGALTQWRPITFPAPSTTSFPWRYWPWERPFPLWWARSSGAGEFETGGGYQPEDDGLWGCTLSGGGGAAGHFSDTFFPRIYNTRGGDPHAGPEPFCGWMPRSSLQEGFTTAAILPCAPGERPCVIRSWFDSVSLWVSNLSTAFILAHFTGIPLIGMYAVVQVG